MDIVSSYLSNLMLIVGSLFLLIGAIGLIRMPDVFTRMHAASIMETAGASLIIIGLIINTGLHSRVIKTNYYNACHILHILSGNTRTGKGVYPRQFKTKCNK